MHRRDFLRLTTATAAGLMFGSRASSAEDSSATGVATAPANAITLPPLPWAKDALAPFISTETIDYHYGKHHQAYVTNLNKLLEGKPEAQWSLEDLVRKSDGALFNNAAQHWNHSFYWKSLKPGGGGTPTGALADAIIKEFGSFAEARKALMTAATGQFGSGWAWLVVDHGTLAVIKTSNADLPLKHGQQALLTVDVWEHAYYIDYRNDRAKYVNALFDHLLDWDFAAANYATALKG